MAGSREKTWALTVRLGAGTVHQRLAAALKEHGEQGCARRLVELALLGLLAEEAGFTQAAVRGEFALVSPTALRRPACGGERASRQRVRQAPTAERATASTKSLAQLPSSSVVESIVNPEAASAWDALRSQFG